MIESRIRLYQLLIRLINICSCILAFFSSLFILNIPPFIRSATGHLLANGNIPFVCGGAVLSIIFIHLFYFTIASFYDDIYYLPKVWKQVESSLSILIIDCVSFFIIQFILMDYYIPLLFYFYYCAISLFFIISLRYLSNELIAFCVKKYNKTINILILGTNQRACDFHIFINEHSLLGYNVIGFIDDHNYSDNDIPLIGKLEDFDRVLRENVIDRSVVFLPIRSYYDRIISIIDRSENQGIALQLMANIFQPKFGCVSPAIMGNFFGILYDAMPLDDWRLRVKRIFDVAFALFLLLASSPVMLLAAVCIKFQDGGPVFFSQSRIGYRKRPFRIYKFRTMVQNAEALQSGLEKQNEMTGPVFKIKSDPRVTRVGRILRKYTIDELPQLFNVILGDMSIVGPRPMAIRDYSGFSEDWLRRRFSVRPGLTCYWQCRMNRNDLPFDEWMRLDMNYIDNWSLTEDLKICLKTVLIVFSGSGH